MPAKSSSSAGAIYLDRAQRIEELRRSAISARVRMPEIRRVILFGSLVTNSATPRSDADILIVVESSKHDHTRDRVPEMLRALSPLPCPVDLFVVTCNEVDRFQAAGSPLLRVALKTGMDLL